MASIVLLRNPLSPHSREISRIPAGTPVIDWLQQEHPHGFGVSMRFYVNGEEKALDDLDYRMQEDDVAVIALMPADPATLTSIAISFAISAALAAVSFAVQYFFFKPKELSGPKGEKRSVYDVASDQNAARVGEAVPVIYGSVLTTPDYISQPYVWYSWSQASAAEPLNGIQYLDVLMCVGQGNIDVTDVFVGDTDVTTLPAGVVTWQVFRPAQHNKTMGTIAAAMGAGFYENVVTSAEVGNQELAKANDTAGYFAACKPGQKGRIIQIDLVCPNGLYFVTTDPGDVVPFSVTLTVQWIELDDNDNQVGTAFSQSVTISTSAPGTSDNIVLTSPVRRTISITASKSARWAVRITRTSNPTRPQKGQSQTIWSGLKLVLDNATGQVYGDVTLLACRIKASNGIAGDAAVRVSCRATRRLRPPTGGSEVQSTSAADAFTDVLVDTVYGAARPRSEVDTALLTTLRTTWAAYQFNHVFRERITVWEALRTITTPFGAEPLPLGAMMSVAQDGVKSVRSALFTDANIVAGSMNVSYSFDEEGVADGVEIEYLDAKDFRQSYTVWPTTAQRPDRFTLPGVTSATHAAQFARLTWQRSQQQRKRITFDTEMEGLILQLGDRIGVAHNVPKWGEAGLVIGRTGNTLTVDRSLNWAGGSKQILLRRPDGGVTNAITVTRGERDNQVVLPAAPPTTINFDNDYEYTSFAFGPASTLVQDFVVIAAKPAGDKRVTVEAVNYAPGIYTGAMSFMS
ncbi:MAG: hypothetical protein IOC86_16540 [Aestuariivirga sp.]|nr:hypothetical protein [Aestuariivirga sp.]